MTVADIIYNAHCTITQQSQRAGPEASIINQAVKEQKALLHFVDYCSTRAYLSASGKLLLIKKIVLSI